jgi:hypothetical protein
MSESLNLIYYSIDEQNADKSAATRRQLVAGTAATLGGLGLLGLADEADAAPTEAAVRQNPQTILNVAATAEVLATIVNTVGGEQAVDFFNTLPGGEQTAQITRQNVRAAAREELEHYKVLRSLGARPLTRTIYVPNAYLANATGLLSALEIGDQIFVNAYLLATTVFAGSTSLRSGLRGRLARVTSEFCGVEAVHRALARQSLGKLGNDRVFLRYSTPETANAPSPNPNAQGFRNITTAVRQLQGAGFGFGRPGSLPGTAFDFDVVSQRTRPIGATGEGPLTGDVNTIRPR